ncbi:MAG TPA: carboxymuconolactone decarboxylase family protein [Propionibacteriaceae bacterium]|nr:carboxymuconolactone decarboxylase family protein [Propionibacteriaceae bacterium]
MSTEDTNRQEQLGGRLALLSSGEMSEDQRRLHDRVLAGRGAAAARSGYVAALPDGRLIGPFNALLHAPDIAEHMLAWAASIAGALESAGTDPVLRETVILTVAARRQAAYALYAHTQAARRAGLSDRAVTAIVEGRTPDDLPPEALTAHRLARALADGTPVDDATYTEGTSRFGVAQLVGLVSLVGQYLTTCAVLACFDVPAPQQPNPVNPKEEP